MAFPGAELEAMVVRTTVVSLALQAPVGRLVSNGTLGKADLAAMRDIGSQRPHPRITGKLFHPVSSPAALDGPGCASRAVTVPGLEQQSALNHAAHRFILFRYHNNLI